MHAGPRQAGACCTGAHSSISFLQYVTLAPGTQVPAAQVPAPVPHFSASLQYLASVPHFSTSLQYLASVPDFSTSLQYLTSVPRFSTSLQYLTSVPRFSTSLQYLASVPHFSTSLVSLSLVCRPCQEAQPCTPTLIHWGIKAQRLGDARSIHHHLYSVPTETLVAGMAGRARAPPAQAPCITNMPKYQVLMVYGHLTLPSRPCNNNDMPR